MLGRTGEQQRTRVFAVPEIADQLAEVVIDPPDRTFETDAIVEIGVRRLELRYLGRGHTDNDVLVRGVLVCPRRRPGRRFPSNISAHSRRLVQSQARRTAAQVHAPVIPRRAPRGMFPAPRTDRIVTGRIAYHVGCYLVKTAGAATRNGRAGKLETTGACDNADGSTSRLRVALAGRSTCHHPPGRAAFSTTTWKKSFVRSQRG
jgi:hypothetical protein